MDGFSSHTAKRADELAGTDPDYHIHPLDLTKVRYPDAHRYRLGVNFETPPVNPPVCPVHNCNRDGFMRADENGGETPNYQPNSFDGPVEDPQLS